MRNWVIRWSGEILFFIQEYETVRRHEAILPGIKNMLIPESREKGGGFKMIIPPRAAGHHASS